MRVGWETKLAKRAIIGLETLDQMRERSLAVARRLDAGKRVPEADYHLNFETAGQLLAEISRERLRLLAQLHEAGPSTVYALAKRLERNYSNVHADVKRLLELGLIERDEQKRVWVPWREIRITLPLAKAA